MSKGTKYFQFPLTLIRDIHTDWEACEQKILNFCLVEWAHKQQVTADDISRQLLYLFYQKKLPDKYYSLLNGLGISDEYYRGFLGKREFDPPFKEEVWQLLQKNLELKAYALERCQLNKINNFFGVSGPDDDVRLERYYVVKTVIDAHEYEHGKEPRPTIEKHLFFDLVRDPDLFSVYVAIRSLEGRKKFVATNRPTIAGRAAGYKSKALLPEDDPVFTKFNKRYQFDKILARLIDRNLVKSVFRQKSWRKFYISTKIGPEELAQAVVEHSGAYRMRKINDKAKMVYQQLYKGATI